ncbi:hypothetical protein LMG27952_03157 [Paraburkholderia hiiakae]|uniref:Lipoprotein n=1 Tax=Paraburkholderia hiiakae TaxID=1081782 RepID=A0ABN7HTH4_9BURK|nr:hypothetical protein [Paraburkholderia hiiakae]CAD6536494.1 hypothetical protein LMG27952_03157 [Paraburkholderia hiiakae]
MKKKLSILLLGCVALSACGGGSGGSDSSATTTKKLTVSMYGNPLASGASTKVARAQFSLISSAMAADAPSAASDAQATVQTLQDALTSRGVPAQVSAGVMDGTTLHQIVMGENNGLPPTPDQFKTEPSEWIVVNFQLDDMVTRADDPAQLAAQAQFSQDLAIFTQRANVSGKRVFAIMAIPTCDVPNQNSAADGLNHAILNAGLNSTISQVGGTPFQGVRDANGDVVNGLLVGHMGGDCRTPDAYMQNYHIQAIADDLASRYQGYLNGN